MLEKKILGFAEWAWTSQTHVYLRRVKNIFFDVFQPFQQLDKIFFLSSRSFFHRIVIMKFCDKKTIYVPGVAFFCKSIKDSRLIFYIFIYYYSCPFADFYDPFPFNPTFSPLHCSLDP